MQARPLSSDRKQFRSPAEISIPAWEARCGANTDRKWGEIHPRLLIEIRDDIFRHNVLIFEMLVEIVNEFEPAIVIIHDAAKRVDEKRAFEIFVLRRRAVDSPLRDDRLAILTFFCRRSYISGRLLFPTYIQHKGIQDTWPTLRESTCRNGPRR